MPDLSFSGSVACKSWLLRDATIYVGNLGARAGLGLFLDFSTEHEKIGSIDRPKVLHDRSIR